VTGDDVADAVCVPDDADVSAVYAAGWVRRVAQYERWRGADACVAQHTQSDPLAIGFGLSGQQGCGSDQSQVFAGARSGEPGWPAAVAGLQVPRPAGAAEEHVKERASTLAKSAWLEVEQIAAGRVAVVSRLSKPPIGSRVGHSTVTVKAG